MGSCLTALFKNDFKSEPSLIIASDVAPSVFIKTFDFVLIIIHFIVRVGPLSHCSIENEVCLIVLNVVYFKSFSILKIVLADNIILIK